MKPVQEVIVVFERLIQEKRATTQHLCLYVSICYWWVQNKCQSPVAISRKLVMDMSKIKGIATYHKCMKELHQWGFIHYHPSFHPELGSTVYVVTGAAVPPDASPVVLPMP